MIEVLLWIIFIFGGFLLGGVMFCRTIPLLFMKKDVCAESADHNPGAASVFHACGVPMGLFCLFLDMLKGFLPVFLATFFLDVTNMLFAAVIIAPVLGHAVGVFNHFHGGKCIATSFGIVLGLMPVTQIGWLLAGLYIFFSVVVKISPHRRRSMLTYIIFGTAATIILLILKQHSLAIGCLGISAVACVKHLKIFSPDEAPVPEESVAMLKDDDEPVKKGGN